MISRWQISAGEISEWLPPLLWAAAVLLSAWVLSDTRRRKFRNYAVAAAWTLATLVFPHIVFPLYLITRIFTRKPDPTGTLEESTTLEASTSIAASTSPETSHATSPATSPTATEAVHPPARASTSTAHEPAADDTDEQTAGPTTEDIPSRARRKLALPLLYALTLLCVGAIYFYRDYHSFEAHLARAANARLLGERAATIREYRAALRLADDAHTRKLLAIQLSEDGQTAAALAEFRAAERGGASDELLPYRIAHLLDALNRPAEADLEYRKFTQSSLCVRAVPDARCAEAAARVSQTQAESSQ